MAVATRVWERLLLPVPDASREKRRESIEYVGTIFQLAALLHDVGHCAFSHSIEAVEVDGKRLLGSNAELFRAWGEDALLGEYLAAYPDDGAKYVEHEQIGLILVRRIFAEEEVAEACRRKLSTDSGDVGRDVRSVLEDGLSPSDQLTKHLSALAEMYVEAGQNVALYTGLDAGTFPSDFRAILHGLVSGTLDVDRLDYLGRDSMFCGVPYGACDLRILVNSLDIGSSGAGRTELCLDSKAAFALDDMLWSRYQLFMQVYNHKTNVALNAMLARAIPDAIDDARFPKPADFQSYVEFTDDYVMSRILSLCIRGRKLADTVYAKTLAYRKVPMHLGFVELVEGAKAATEEEAKQRTKEEVAARIAEKATERGVKPEQLLTGRAKSELIKAAALPNLISWGKPSGKKVIEAFEQRSRLFQGKTLPTAYDLLHFFVER